MKKMILAAALAFAATFAVDANQRWNIVPESDVIVMDVARNALPHSDHIEMSGRKMSVVLYWDLDSSAAFGLRRALVFPMLRTIPNDTHASLMVDNDIDIPSMLRINGRKFALTADTIEINGAMTVKSHYTDGKGRSLALTSRIFPSMTSPAMCEQYTAVNTGTVPLEFLIPSVRQTYTTNPAKGVGGSYVILSEVDGAGALTLQPGESADFSLNIQAYPLDGGSPAALDAAKEYSDRMDFVATLDSALILNTPDKAIDTEFRYAKIRGAESIYDTKGGLMHGPGGESYYAALWANDQAEYINPFFPFLGYATGNESALNCFRHYARFMNDDYRPLPSSIIAEGDDIWAGAGDRGDAAMIAYGAARYALARADRAEALELWPLIQWCLEYCRRNLNEEGVVRSDCDELENRFPAGDANLCTASLYYDALISASYLAKSLGKAPNVTANYLRQAKALRTAIENYFGDNVKGYDTYRYYAGNDVLRSWICIPLVVGIDDRADETVKALFSPEMYTADGVLTSQGYPVFWDRATLYTLRGALYAGYPDEVIPRLSAFSSRRLLGDHVPYPVEAWPEGSQRHLSAESGLYCRVITEGLFGIRPTGMDSFMLKPELPKDWDYAELRHIRAFGNDFDILVTRLTPDKYKITITNHTTSQTTTHTLPATQAKLIKL